MSSLKKKYDVIVIGCGAIAHATAVKCAQLGLTTLCAGKNSINSIDNLNFTGDTCSENMSIIALLESVKLYQNIAESINKHGIYVDGLAVDLQQMMQRKNTILKNMDDYLLNKFHQHQVDFACSTAQLLNSNTVKLLDRQDTNKDTIQAEHIILATDSIPISLPFALIDNNFILDSTSALNFTEIPKSIAILGAGVIGLEIAGIWRRLGAKVTILEAQDIFLSVVDDQISSLAYQLFVDQDIELRLGTRVISTQIIGKKVVVKYLDVDGVHAIKIDKLIVASGRKPNSEYLAAAEANLLLDENGFVHVDEKLRTNLPGVYAIGDLTLYGPMLTHKGIAEGIFVAEQIAGKRGTPINYMTIPNIIYTEPEISWVGHTEQNLKSVGEPIKTFFYSFQNNFHARATDKFSGFIKIIIDSKNDQILGAHIIGNNSAELIAEAALAIDFSANIDDFTRSSHAHPGYSEIFHEVFSNISLNI